MVNGGPSTTSRPGSGGSSGREIDEVTDESFPDYTRKYEPKTSKHTRATELSVSAIEDDSRRIQLYGSSKGDGQGHVLKPIKVLRVSMYGMKDAHVEVHSFDGRAAATRFINTHQKQAGPSTYYDMGARDDTRQEDHLLLVPYGFGSKFLEAIGTGTSPPAPPSTATGSSGHDAVVPTGASRTKQFFRRRRNN